MIEILFFGLAYALIELTFSGNVSKFWPLLPLALILGLLAFELISRLSRRKVESFYSREFNGDEAQSSIGISSVAHGGELDAGSGDLFRDYLETGRTLIRSDRYDEAVDILTKALDLDPGNSKAYNFLGIAFARMGRCEESIESYCKAIALDYDYASAHFNLAIIYEEAGRRRDAVDEWRRYLDIGEIVGEREDMLERARNRIKELSAD